MLVTNVVNVKLLQNAQEEYKQCADQYNTINELIVHCPNLKKLTGICPNTIDALNNAFQQHNLQPSILAEYAAFYLFSQALGLISMTKGTNTCRYIYNKPGTTIELRQYGGCQYLDGEIYKNNKLIRKFEVKQNIARTMDADLGDIVNGHIKVRPAIKEAWNEYIPFIESINFWDHLGHNIKLNDNNINQQIAKAYLQQHGDTEILIFGNKGLYYMSIKEYMDHLSYDSSEIRTCGKNNKKAYSIDILDKWLIKCGAKFDGDKVTIALNHIDTALGRGSKVLTRYKMNFIFWVPVDKAYEHDGYITFDKKFVRQNTPNASIHAIFRED